MLETGKIGKHLIIPFSFLLTIFTLYVLNPNSFQIAWHGREPYLLFVWLFLLELILVWDKLHSKPISPKKALAIAILASLPTIYIAATFIYGWQQLIELGIFLGVPYQRYGLHLLYDQWPISFEFLFFLGIFAVFVFVIYGVNGFKWFALSLFFLGVIGFFFTIDNFYPEDTVKILQAMIPYTVSATKFVLSAVGYKVIYNDPMIYFINVSARRPWAASMYWPCSGVQSLFVYSFVILLFLRNFPIYYKRKMISVVFPKKLAALSENRMFSPFLEERMVRSFASGVAKVVVEVIRLMPFFLLFLVGAVGTFFANVLRVATLGVMGANGHPDMAKKFHDYYGDLNFITWVTVFPLLMIFSHVLWRKLYGTT